MSHPFFSIIIPTFNSEKTIETCMLSILNQTFKDYEILVIDASSIDKTLNLIDSLSKKYFSKIHVTSEYDNGIFDAMNKGIRIATGDWIYFLGSDDTLFDKNVLSNIFEIIAGCNCDVLYGNVFTSISKKIYNCEFTSEMLFNENICHQSIFLKRNIFDKIGLFNLKYKVFADWDSNFKWFYNKNIIHKYHNVIVANYSEEGMSSTVKDYQFLKDRLGLIIKYGYKTLPLNTIIHISEIACVDSKKEKRYFDIFKYSVYVFFLKSFRKLKNLA